MPSLSASKTRRCICVVKFLLMLKIDADLKAVSMISDTRIYANKDNRVQTFDLHIIEVSSAKYLATKAVLNSSLQGDQKAFFLIFFYLPIYAFSNFSLYFSLFFLVY